MFSRLARALLILALCGSIGAHWAALQSFAWASMLVEYSQQTSLAEALARTFDGQHPCNLCKQIASAQHAPKKNEARASTTKVDLLCTTRTIVLLPRSADLRFAVLEMRAATRVSAPPTPPPRSALV